MASSFISFLVYIVYLCFFFFFSSRRRHTRCSRDWSSDVCSSDLSSPWNHFLDDQVFRRNETAGFLEAPKQGFAVVGTPRLRNREAVGRKPQSRFENDGERAVDAGEFLLVGNTLCPGLVNSQPFSQLVKQPLVARPPQFFPSWNGDAILLGKQLMMDGRQADGIVVRGNQRPIFETVLDTEVQEKVNSFCVFPFRPGNSAAHIARGGRHQMAALLDHPDRNVAPAKTSRHAKSAIVRTHEQSA